MKQVVYIAKTLRGAKAFIEANTKWQRVAQTRYVNHNEAICIATNIDQLRGRQFDKAYIDYSFTSINDRDYIDIERRLKRLGLTPMEITEAI